MYRVKFTHLFQADIKLSGLTGIRSSDGCFYTLVLYQCSMKDSLPLILSFPALDIFSFFFFFKFSPDFSVVILVLLVCNVNPFVLICNLDSLLLNP